MFPKTSKLKTFKRKIDGGLFDADKRKKMTAEYPLSSDPRPGRTWQLAGPPLRPQQARSARASPLEERNQQLKKRENERRGGSFRPRRARPRATAKSCCCCFSAYDASEIADIQNVNECRNRCSAPKIVDPEIVNERRNRVSAFSLFTTVDSEILHEHAGEKSKIQH